MSASRFTVSVVIPVYGVEAYLAEAIESVIAQSIGFERNVQLILVNDGSPDDSERICLRYRDRYPDNVEYVQQANAGVSAARNTGLRLARGTYVNFLDGDDIWERHAFARAVDFLEAHPDIDLAAARLRFFGARSSDHYLDFRFQGDRVIDIDSEYHFTQMHVASVFLRRAALSGHEFDVGLKYAEDFKFVTPIILAKRSYAALSSVEFGYRRRDDGGSAMDRVSHSRSWYVDTPVRAHRHLFEYARDVNGRVPAYVQYAVMYEVQWRFSRIVDGILSEEETVEYKARIAELLRDIDDLFIVEQRHIGSWYKLYALALKRGIGYEQALAQVSVAGGYVTYEGNRLKRLGRQQLLIEIIDIEGDSLVLEGSLKMLFDPKDIDISFDVGGRQHPAELIERKELHRTALGQVIHRPVGFRVVLPLCDKGRLSARVRVRGMEFQPLLSFGMLAPLSSEGGSGICRVGAYTLIRKKRSVVIEREVGLVTRAMREARYLARLALRRGDWSTIAYRLAYWALFPVRRCRATWLISDRVVTAGDNGEAFFRFVAENAPRRIRPVFAIAADSDDFEPLKRVGTVVPFGTVRYRLEFLLADKIISSAADAYVTDAFDDRSEYLKDLYGFDFVFLQHGITQNDLSGWLNRYRKNIRAFVTTAATERKSILAGPYYYDETIVQLTGLPRHDRLFAEGEAQERKLVIMPTWRKHLANDLDPVTGTRKPLEGFTESEYHRSWTALITDPRLHEALEAHDFTAKFFIHPALIQEADTFPSTGRVSVERECDYQHEFRTASIMVTDYSSVAFDFALLSKPLAYMQVDHENFFEDHFCEPGYFDYTQDGFGPVCTTVDDTVDAIIDLISAGCVRQDEYEKRAHSFFGDRPKISSSEAVYREVLALGDGPRRRR